MCVILKRLFSCAACILLVVFCRFPCYAEENGSAAAQLYETLDSSQLSLPECAEVYFNKNGISKDDPESVLNLSPEAFFTDIWDTLKTEAAAPLVLCGGLLSLVLLASFLQVTGDTVSEGGMRSAAELLFTLICIGSVANPLCRCLAGAAEALEEGNVFMTGYVPVFSTFLAAGGAIGSGTTYQVFMFFLTELEAHLTGKLLFPLLQMATAIGIADAVNPSLRLGTLVSGFRTFLKWGLGFMMSAFSAVLSIRSFVASAADTVTSKTFKLISSGFIPIIGGAVSDSLGTIQGSIGLLRNGIGAVGILALLWMMIPKLISLILYRIVFSAAGTAAAMTGADTLTQLFKNAHSVLSAAFAMLICFSLMLVFSTALMLLMIHGG